MDKSIVINNINKLVDDSNLSRGAFADMVGIPRSNFSKILNGNYPCGEGVINKIVLATKVRKEWLKTGEGNIYEENQENIINSCCIPNNKNSINERFGEILKYKKISIKEAALALGKTDVYIRKILRPGESFGIEPVIAILNSFPDVNGDWMLTGRGEMLKNISGNSEALNIQIPTVPEIDKNDPDVMLSLLSIIKEQGETLKDAVSNKNQKYIEQQTKILEGIETLKNIVERREKEYEILLKKIDQVISANNISGQKKVI